MSKQLKEHFEHGMPFGGKPPEKEPSAGAVTPRTAGKAGAACLKQHDLVNTANVALVRAQARARVASARVAPPLAHAVVRVLPSLRCTELRPDLVTP